MRGQFSGFFGRGLGTTISDLGAQGDVLLGGTGGFLGRHVVDCGCWIVVESSMLQKVRGSEFTEFLSVRLTSLKEAKAPVLSAFGPKDLISAGTFFPLPSEPP
jgi:hypothetical protein